MRHPLLSSFTQKDQLKLLCPLKDIKLTNFYGISSAAIVQTTLVHCYVHSTQHLL
jgi:hypothetical protein